jgi:hypothetical protein
VNRKKAGFDEMRDEANLTELQATVVEVYHQRLSETLPDVEILDAYATDGIIHVRLNDASMKDYSTLSGIAKLSIEVGDQFNVPLLPHTVPHEN